MFFFLDMIDFCNTDDYTVVLQYVNGVPWCIYFNEMHKSVFCSVNTDKIQDSNFS